MAIAPGTALVLSGLLSSAGQIYANQQNLKNTNRWNDIQVDLANTAHQREVLDLQAAGLNPVLSAGGSGSSVPQLGSTDISNPGEGLSRAISSAVKLDKLEAPKVASQIAVNSAQAENLKNLGELYKAQAEAVKNTKGLIGELGENSTSLGEWLGEKIGNFLGPDTNSSTGLSRLKREIIKRSINEEKTQDQVIKEMREENLKKRRRHN